MVRSLEANVIQPAPTSVSMESPIPARVVLPTSRERPQSLESTFSLLPEYSPVDHTASSRSRTSAAHRFPASNTSQTPNQPPRYSCVSPQETTVPELETERAHTFHLSDNKNVTWATLELQSNSASRQSLPRYGDRKYITGTVKLRLPSSQTIHSISLQVRPLKNQERDRNGQKY